MCLEVRNGWLLSALWLVGFVFEGRRIARKSTWVNVAGAACAFCWQSGIRGLRFALTNGR